MAAEELIRRYLSKAMPRLAARARQWGIPIDDLRQEAALAILRAAQTYRPDRGRSFGSHAYQWINARMADAVWRDGCMFHVPVRRRKAVAAGWEPLPSIVRSQEEGDEDDFQAIPANLSVADAVEEAELKDRLMDALGKINPRWAHIIYRRFWEDRSFREIAEEMGVTSEAVRQSFHRAISALGRMLSDLSEEQPGEMGMARQYCA